MFMNECIDSTIGRIHVCLSVLLVSDDPRTSCFMVEGMLVPGVWVGGKDTDLVTVSCVTWILRATTERVLTTGLGTSDMCDLFPY
jgi:hypothetical protein